MAGVGGAALGGAVGATFGVILGTEMGRRISNFQRWIDRSADGQTDVPNHGCDWLQQRQDESEHLSVLAQRLARVRNECGITVEELSVRCGISSEFLAELETNWVSPTLSQVRRIAKALGVTELFLLGGVQTAASDDFGSEEMDGVAWMVGRRFASYLENLNPTERQELREASVEQRFTFAVGFLCHTFPSSFTPTVLALLLNLSPDTFERILHGGEPIARYTLCRLTQVTGISIRFFSVGDIREDCEAGAVSTEQALEYLQPISAAVRGQLPAAHLTALIAKHLEIHRPS
jgi:transcriptional regulator with XRE-family HTH domain